MADNKTMIVKIERKFEMTDNQKALDAFNRLMGGFIPMDRHPDIVKSDVDDVKAALTAQPAGDDVREAVEAANDYIQHRIDGEDEGVLDGYVDDGATFTFKHLQTLIKAALRAPAAVPRDDVTEYDYE